MSLLGRGSLSYPQLLIFALDDQPEDRFGTLTIDGGGTILMQGSSTRSGSMTISGGGTVLMSGAGTGSGLPGAAGGSSSIGGGARMRRRTGVGPSAESEVDEDT